MIFYLEILISIPEFLPRVSFLATEPIGMWIAFQFNRWWKLNQISQNSFTTQPWEISDISLMLLGLK